MLCSNEQPFYEYSELCVLFMDWACMCSIKIMLCRGTGGLRHPASQLNHTTTCHATPHLSIGYSHTTLLLPHSPPPPPPSLPPSLSPSVSLLQIMDKRIGSSGTGMERRAGTLATPPQFPRIRQLAAASPSPNTTGKKHPGKAILAGECMMTIYHK